MRRRLELRLARQRQRAGTPGWVADERDRGAILPLVLVLVVVAALIVIPVTTYTTSVLRANHVEATKTRNVEAAKGAVRAALRQPGLLFGDKDQANASCPPNPADLVPPGGVTTATSVSITCTPVTELSANEVFGFKVPVGAAQLQVAPDPATSGAFSGVVATSGDAPPYPTTGTAQPWAWWQTYEWVNPVDSSDVKTVWLPDLPSFSGAERESTPLDMPGFDCQVFLPGYYPDPLVIDGTGPSDNYYFTSGVYYFERPITISGDVDVVVGQGLADFGVTNDCADDVQVGANVSVPADTVYGIDGNSGGATWVLGDEARIQISETGGAPSVRFNQRYAPVDRGGWTNILSVNGDWSYDNGDTSDDDDFEDAEGNHSVTNVNWVPRSNALQIEDDESVVVLELGQVGAEYVPSHPDLTDEARPPAAPSAVSGEVRVDGVDASVFATFSGVEASATNGAIVDAYEAGIQTSGGAPAPTATCTTEGSVPTLLPATEGANGTDPWGRSHPENASDPDTYACLIGGLSSASTYYVTARAHNEAGWSDWTTPSQIKTLAGPPSPADAPSNVTVQPYDDDPGLPDAALVSWDASPSTDGAPISGYDVEVYRVFEVDAATTTTTTSTTTTTTTSTTTTTTTTTPTTTTTTTTLPPLGSDCGPPLNCAAIPACASGDEAAAWWDGGASEWQSDCVPSCPAGQHLTYYSQVRRCAPPGFSCTSGRTPVYSFFSGWYCQKFSNSSWDIRYRRFDYSRPPSVNCPSGFAPKLGYGTVYCSPSGPSGFRAASTPQPVGGSPSTGTTTSTSTTTVPANVASFAGVSPVPATGPPTTTTTTTTAPIVYVEVEEPIALAEATCSTEPHMGKQADDADLEWTPPPTQCVIPNLPPLPATGTDGNTNVGYRVKVTARTAAGSSAPATFEPPFMSIPGTPGSLDPDPATRVWFPRATVPIIDIDTSGAGTTTIDIPGYVSVPMGRVRIANGNGDDVAIVGGIAAGRLDVSDSRSSLPIGYVPSVIMQRTMELTATAGNIQSTARVKINSDTSYGIVRWVTQ